MGKISEYLKNLINTFLQPTKPEGELSELALAEGMTRRQIEELKRTQNGATGWKLEIEEQETSSQTGIRAILNNRVQAKGKQPNQSNQQIQSTHERDVNNDGAR